MGTRHLRLTAFPAFPTIGFKYTPEGIQLSGAAGDFTNSVFESMNSTYSVLVPPEISFGTEDENGTWNGLIGMLQRNEADITLPFMIRSIQRDVVGLPSRGTVYDYYALVGGIKQLEETNLFGYILTFEVNVWICLLLFWIVLSFLAGAMGAFTFHSKAEVKPLRERVQEFIWTLCENMLCESSVQVPIENHLRIIIAFWWIAIIVLMNSFAGQMSACMMVKSKPKTINSVAELVKYPHIKPYVTQDSMFEDTFKLSDRKEYKSLYKMMLQQNTRVSFTEIFGDEIFKEILDEKAVVLQSQSLLAYYVAAHCKRLKYGMYYVASEKINGLQTIYYYNKNLPEHFRNAVDKRLVHLFEGGITSYIVTKTFGDVEFQSRKCSIGPRKIAMEFSDMIALFYLYLVCCSICTVAFFTEIFAHCLKKLYR